METHTVEVESKYLLTIKEVKNLVDLKLGDSGKVISVKPTGAAAIIQSFIRRKALKAKTRAAMKIQKFTRKRHSGAAKRAAAATAMEAAAAAVRVTTNLENKRTELLQETANRAAATSATTAMEAATEATARLADLENQIKRAKLLQEIQENAKRATATNADTEENTADLKREESGGVERTFKSTRNHEDDKMELDTSKDDIVQDMDNIVQDIKNLKSEIEKLYAVSQDAHKKVAAMISKVSEINEKRGREMYKEFTSLKSSTRDVLDTLLKDISKAESKILKYTNTNPDQRTYRIVSLIYSNTRKKALSTMNLVQGHLKQQVDDVRIDAKAFAGAAEADAEKRATTAAKAAEATAKKAAVTSATTAMEAAAKAEAAATTAVEAAAEANAEAIAVMKNLQLVLQELTANAAADTAMDAATSADAAALHAEDLVKASQLINQRTDIIQSATSFHNQLPPPADYEKKDENSKNETLKKIKTQFTKLNDLVEACWVVLISPAFNKDDESFEFLLNSTVDAQHAIPETMTTTGYSDYIVDMNTAIENLDAVTRTIVMCWNEPNGENCRALRKIIREGQTVVDDKATGDKATDDGEHKDDNEEKQVTAKVQSLIKAYPPELQKLFQPNLLKLATEITMNVDDVAGSLQKFKNHIQTNGTHLLNIILWQTTNFRWRIYAAALLTMQAMDQEVDPETLLKVILFLKGAVNKIEEDKLTPQLQELTQNIIAILVNATETSELNQKAAKDAIQYLVLLLGYLEHGEISEYAAMALVNLVVINEDNKSEFIHVGAKTILMSRLRKTPTVATVTLMAALVNDNKEIPTDNDDLRVLQKILNDETHDPSVRVAALKTLMLISFQNPKTMDFILSEVPESFELGKYTGLLPYNDDEDIQDINDQLTKWKEGTFEKPFFDVITYNFNVNTQIAEDQLIGRTEVQNEIIQIDNLINSAQETKNQEEQKVIINATIEKTQKIIENDETRLVVGYREALKELQTNLQKLQTSLQKIKETGSGLLEGARQYLDLLKGTYYQYMNAVIPSNDNITFGLVKTAFNTMILSAGADVYTYDITVKTHDDEEATRIIKQIQTQFKDGTIFGRPATLFYYAFNINDDLNRQSSLTQQQLYSENALGYRVYNTQIEPRKWEQGDINFGIITLVPTGMSVADPELQRAVRNNEKIIILPPTNHVRRLALAQDTIWPIRNENFQFDLSLLEYYVKEQKGITGDEYHVVMAMYLAYFSLYLCPALFYRTDYFPVLPRDHRRLGAVLQEIACTTSLEQLKGDLDAFLNAPDLTAFEETFIVFMRAGLELEPTKKLIELMDSHPRIHAMGYRQNQIVFDNISIWRFASEDDIIGGGRHATHLLRTRDRVDALIGGLTALDDPSTTRHSKILEDLGKPSTTTDRQTLTTELRRAIGTTIVELGGGAMPDRSTAQRARALGIRGTHIPIAVQVAHDINRIGPDARASWNKILALRGGAYAVAATIVANTVVDTPIQGGVSARLSALAASCVNSLQGGSDITRFKNVLDVTPTRREQWFAIEARRAARETRRPTPVIPHPLLKGGDPDIEGIDVTGIDKIGELDTNVDSDAPAPQNQTSLPVVNPMPITEGQNTQAPPRVSNPMPLLPAAPDSDSSSTFPGTVIWKVRKEKRGRIREKAVTRVSEDAVIHATPKRTIKRKRGADGVFRNIPGVPIYSVEFSFELQTDQPIKELTLQMIDPKTKKRDPQFKYKGPANEREEFGRSTYDNPGSSGIIMSPVPLDKPNPAIIVVETGTQSLGNHAFLFKIKILGTGGETLKQYREMRPRLKVTFNNATKTLFGPRFTTKPSRDPVRPKCRLDFKPGQTLYEKDGNKVKICEVDRNGQVLNNCNASSTDGRSS